jgi:hypothetical protein
MRLFSFADLLDGCVFIKNRGEWGRKWGSKCMHPEKSWAFTLLTPHVVCCSRHRRWETVAQLRSLQMQLSVIMDSPDSFGWRLVCVIFFSGNVWFRSGGGSISPGWAIGPDFVCMAPWRPNSSRRFLADQSGNAASPAFFINESASVYCLWCTSNGLVDRPFVCWINLPSVEMWSVWFVSVVRLPFSDFVYPSSFFCQLFRCRSL